MLSVWFQLHSLFWKLRARFSVRVKAISCKTFIYYSFCSAKGVCPFSTFFHDANSSVTESSFLFINKWYRERPYSHVFLVEVWILRVLAKDKCVTFCILILIKKVRNATLLSQSLMLGKDQKRNLCFLKYKINFPLGNHWINMNSQILGAR